MKKLLLIAILFPLIQNISAQNFEFRLRGGVNMQKSKISESDFAFYPHFGVMAGIRLSTFGVYAEGLFSEAEYDDGSIDNPVREVKYIVPAVLGRWYTYKYLYIEAGIPFYIPFEDDSIDTMAGFYAGLGLSLKKIEVGLRSQLKPVSQIQLTGSFRF